MNNKANDGILPPVLLYKYLDINGGICTLSGRSIKFSPPNEFNDPFEFMPGGYSRDTPEKRLHIVRETLRRNPKYRYIYNSISGLPYSIEEWNIALAMNTEQIQKIADKIFDGLQHRDWKEFADKASTHVVCSSFSEFSDNLLMWAHYAEMHKGIVIGFKTEFFSHLHKVTYSAERVTIPFSFSVSDAQFQNAVIALMTTKSRDWEYEHEWRSILSTRNLTKSNGMYLLKFPPEAVDSIILGVNIDDSLRKEILASILTFPNCKLYRAELHRSRFALNIVSQ